MPTTRSLSAVLDAAESSGKLNLRMEEIQAALPDLSAEALRQALHRQQRRGRLIRLSRGSGHWLIVPLRHAAVGAPPLETWLDRYLSKTLGIPYYMALLSAAELYGASPYAVMVTQVMVAERRRPITVGRHELVFRTRARIEHMPHARIDRPRSRAARSDGGGHLPSAAAVRRVLLPVASSTDEHRQNTPVRRELAPIPLLFHTVATPLCRGWIANQGVTLACGIRRMS
jgi:hypothetical protein